MLSCESLFSLPFKIDLDVQKQLLQWQEQQAADPAKVFLRQDTQGRSFQRMTEVRFMHPADRVFGPSGEDLRRARWYKLNDPIADLVDELLRPVLPFYEFLGPVTIRASREVAIPAHYDNHYHHPEIRPQGYHGKYFGLMIPLSVEDNDRKHPPFYVVDRQGKYNICSDDHYFMFDQTRVLHGVEARTRIGGA
jgi:hypothetical protein